MSAVADELKATFTMWLERAERLVKQQRKDKHKLYALHAPEVECIDKAKANKTYEFGVKASLVTTHKKSLIMDAKVLPNNLYNGRTLAEQIEQTNIILMDQNITVKTVYADLGYRGVDEALEPVTVIHRGKAKSLTKRQWRCLKRRQAIEPIIGYVKQDHGMRRCWLKGQIGDALHTISCALGFNIRWLMRAIVRLGRKPFFALVFLCGYISYLVNNPHTDNFDPA